MPAWYSSGSVILPMATLRSVTPSAASFGFSSASISFWISARLDE